MREYFSNKRERDFKEACWLFGEEDCNKIKSLIEEGKDRAARNIIASWNLPTCCSCECVRLVMGYSNEKARDWFKLNGVEL